MNTQRRLTALEADLALAEKRAVEKKNGEKYHAVKFFERQKLVRLIKRAQRGLSELPAEEGEGEKEKKKAAKKAAKERTRLEKELFDARCMLNYIIHFPYVPLVVEMTIKRSRYVEHPSGCEAKCAQDFMHHPLIHHLSYDVC